MKKNLLYITAILFCSLFLTSCGKEDYAFTASSSEFLYDGYVYSTNENCIITYRKADSTEESPLCFDPLCDHGYQCQAYTWGRRPQIAVTLNKAGDLCVYYSDEVVNLEENMQRDVFLYCINVAQGTKTAVIAPNGERINNFFLYGNEIYLCIQQGTFDENGNAVASGINVWKASADGTDLTQLTQFEEQSVNIAAISEINGKTVVYWIDYYNNRTLYASPADFSEKTKLMDNVPMYGNFIINNTLYYSTDSTTVSPALITEAHPEDKDKNADGTRTVYREQTLSAYYRLNLTDPNAEPVLMYDGVKSPSTVDTPFWTDGEMMYVIPYEPVFLETISATREGVITGDIVTDSLPQSLEIDYIASKSGSKILQIDLTNGEQRQISTPGFDPLKIIGVIDGKIVLQGDVVDGDRIRARLEEEGVTSSSFTFSEIQTIDLK